MGRPLGLAQKVIDEEVHVGFGIHAAAPGLGVAAQTCQDWLEEPQVGYNYGFFMVVHFVL